MLSFSGREAVMAAVVEIEVDIVLLVWWVVSARKREVVRKSESVSVVVTSTYLEIHYS